MKALLLACAVIGASCAASASTLSDLYVDAAAITMRCKGEVLSEKDAAMLAAAIAHDSGESISPADLLSRIARAKDAFSGADCDSPTAQIHVYWLTKVLLPRVSASPAKTEETTG